MARHALEPRYFASRNGYYTTVRGKQVPLASGPEGGETLAAAWTEFRRVHAANPTAYTDTSTLYAVLQAYLTWVEANRSGKTYHIRREYLADFSGFFGQSKSTGDLRRHHVDAWLTSHPTWGDTSRAMAVDSLKAALRWAVDSDMITRNPLAGYRKVSGAGARVTLLTREQHEALVNRFGARRRPDFARLLEVLWETGARPGELAGATAADLDAGRGTVTLTRHKTARKTGKRRVIYLTPRALEVVVGQAAAHPTGPLFPNERGTAYSDVVLANKFALACARLGIEATAYSYRHTYATDWLRAGKPVAMLAELLGTSIGMIQRHYGHLAEHAADLRAAVQAFTR